MCCTDWRWVKKAVVDTLAERGWSKREAVGRADSGGFMYRLAGFGEVEKGSEVVGFD